MEAAFPVGPTYESLLDGSVAPQERAVQGVGGLPAAAVGDESAVGHRAGEVGARARGAHVQCAEDLDQVGAGQLLDLAQPVQEGEGATADGGGAGSVCHALILRPSRPDEGRMRGLADGAGARGGAAPVDTRRGTALPLSLNLITKREESEH